MGSSMFSLNKSAKLSSATNTNILKKLTAIRVAGYKMLEINKEIGEQHYEAIATLIKELGGKILKVNLIDSKGTDKFLTARNQFNEIVSTLIKAGKFPIVFYAAQLLQFYTMLCDNQFKPNLNIKNFHKFLSDKKQGLGNTDNNLFIAEYKLILIYNELVAHLESHDDAEGQIKNDNEQLESLNSISHQLTNLREHIDQWIADAPSNIFLHYLSFIHEYTSAKFIEFQFRMKSDSPKEKMLELTKVQVNHLSLAKEALDKIDELNLYFQEIGSKYSSGIEFSMGQSILSKLPETNADEIKTHILSLIALNTETTD